MPNQFTFRLPDWRPADRTSTAALFVQDSWTRGRLTLQGALRYDRASSFSPAEDNGTTQTSRSTPAPITFERTAGVDALQRHHAARRRRLRRVRQRQDGAQVQLRPLPRRRDERQRVHAQQPGEPHRPHVPTADWTDTNSNKVVDCDLLNFAAQTTATLRRADRQRPELRQRSGNLDAGEPGDAARAGASVRTTGSGAITVQQELMPRVSAGGRLQPPLVPRASTVTDNQASRRRTDYQPFTLTAPQDPRLPGGGGYPITFYDGDGGGRRARRAELRHVRNRLRPGAHQLLARRRLHAERAPPPGPDAPGRHADRPVGRGHLRDAQA